MGRRSRERCASSEDFKKVAKRIDRYRQQKERKAVDLDEKKFLADRADLNAEEEEEKRLEEQETKDRPVVERNYYFNEALAITVDYLGLTNKGKVAATR